MFSDQFSAEFQGFFSPNASLVAFEKSSNEDITKFAEWGKDIRQRSGYFIDTGCGMMF